MTKLEDKYAPVTFDELVFSNVSDARKARQFAEGERTGHLLLHGPYGTGKSAAAKVIAQLRCGSFYPNGPDVFRGEEVDDTQVNAIDNTHTLQRIGGVKHPLVLVDEIDRCKVPHQRHFSYHYDQYKHLGCMVFTTNKLWEVDGGLRDRCTLIDMPSINVAQWYDRANWILEQEGVSLPPAKLNAMLHTNVATVRKLFQVLEGIILNAKANPGPTSPTPHLKLVPSSGAATPSTAAQGTNLPSVSSGSKATAA
ncbi:MAG: AAA family ATPase [Hyphomicrobiales bacterium]